MLPPNLLPKLVTPNPLIPTTLRPTLDLIATPRRRRGPGHVRLGAAAGREAVLDVLHARGAEEEGEGVEGGVLEEAEGCVLLVLLVSWGVEGRGRRWIGEEGGEMGGGRRGEGREGEEGRRGGGGTCEGAGDEDLAAVDVVGFAEVRHE